MHGLEVVKYSVHKLSPGMLRVGFDYLPEKIKEHSIDALVFDCVYFYSEFVAIHLGVPYVQVYNILNLDFSGTTPMVFSAGLITRSRKLWTTLRDCKLSASSFLAW